MECEDRLRAEFRIEMNAAVAESEQRWQDREQELQSQISELQAQLTQMQEQVSPRYLLHLISTCFFHIFSSHVVVTFILSSLKQTEADTSFLRAIKPAESAKDTPRGKKCFWCF